MTSLAEIAPAFVEMAHQIVWCNVATVDRQNRPRSRILHPYWEWDGENLVGWVATAATPIKRAHLEHSPSASLNYWTPAHDTCLAECSASWHFDLETRQKVWNTYLELPEPLGYDPSMIPVWENAESESFAVLRFDPWRVRVMKAEAMVTGQGTLVWQAD